MTRGKEIKRNRSMGPTWFPVVTSLNLDRLIINALKLISAGAKIITRVMTDDIN